MIFIVGLMNSQGKFLLYIAFHELFGRINFSANEVRLTTDKRP